MYDYEEEEISKLYAYVAYVEGNMERIERGGWCPVGFAEFCDSEELATWTEEDPNPLCYPPEEDD